jgi:hypothetical protein
MTATWISGGNAPLPTSIALPLVVGELTLARPPDQVGYQIAADQRGNAWVRTVMTAFGVNLLEQCLIGQAPFSG